MIKIHILWVALAVISLSLLALASASAEPEPSRLRPACSDHRDNDGDGLTDVADPDCSSELGIRESAREARGPESDHSGAGVASDPELASKVRALCEQHAPEVAEEFQALALEMAAALEGPGGGSFTWNLQGPYGLSSTHYSEVFKESFDQPTVWKGRYEIFSRTERFDWRMSAQCNIGGLVRFGDTEAPCSRPIHFENTGEQMEWLCDPVHGSVYMEHEHPGEIIATEAGFWRFSRDKLFIVKSSASASGGIKMTRFKTAGGWRHAGNGEIPNEVLPRAEEIFFEVEDECGGSCQAELLDPIPPILAGGGHATVRGKIRNDGGCRQTFSWSLDPADDFELIVEDGSGTIELEPGEEKIHEIEVSAPGGASPGTGSLSLQASGPGGAICSSPSSATVYTLQLKEVDFLTDHVVYTDRDPPRPYPSDFEWQDNSSPLDGDAEDRGDVRAPIHRVQEQTLSFVGRFQIRPATVTPGPLLVRADVAPLGPPLITPLSFGGAPTAETATLTTLPLPARVDIHDPLAIRWGVSSDGGRSWAHVTTSDNRLYVTLSEPRVSDELYESLLDISCRAAKGAAVEWRVVRDLYARFQTRDVRRKPMDGFNRSDGQRMIYWVNVADPRLPGAQSTCQRYQAMLNPFRNPAFRGIGTCLAWSRLFINCIKAQGISDPQGPFLIRVDPKPPRIGLLVKDWTLQGSGYLKILYPAKAPFTHVKGLDVFDSVGIAGQGLSTTPNPLAEFNLHYIVEYGGEYYDPSYGSPPQKTPMAWEAHSLDGYRGIVNIGRVGMPAVVADDPLATETIFTRW